MFSVTQPSRLSFHATFVSRKSQMALIQILAQKTSRNSKKHVCISVCELHIVSSQPPPPITYTVCALSAGVCVCVRAGALKILQPKRNGDIFSYHRGFWVSTCV